jgi:hypothetical protein
MNDQSPFQSLNLAQVQNDLLKLYQRVACEKGRVEIQGGDGACQCVLISKVELESLERAIQLLADTDGVRQLTDELAHLAHVAGPELAHA